jgi:hypothetical protein
MRVLLSPTLLLQLLQLPGCTHLAHIQALLLRVLHVMGADPHCRELIGQQQVRCQPQPLGCATSCGYKRLVQTFMYFLHVELKHAVVVDQWVSASWFSQLSLAE